MTEWLGRVPQAASASTATASASKCWPATSCASSRCASASRKRWLNDRIETQFQSGFVSIIGRPNAGKSTLLNALVGQKVAIVADKPQTTRTSIQGVVTTARGADRFRRHAGHSPGRFAAQQAPDGHGARRRSKSATCCCSWPMRRASSTKQDRARRRPGAAEPRRRCVLVLNKIDLVKDKAQLLPLIEQYKAAARIRRLRSGLRAEARRHG